MRYFLFLLIFLCCGLQLSAQYTPDYSTTSPYKLEWKKEALITGAGLGLLTTGTILRGNSTLFTPDELLTLNPQDINAFDRIATGYSSEQAHQASNYFWYGSHALPFALLAGKDTRKNFGQISAMYAEVAVVNAGATLLSKYVFKRPRPYVFDSLTTAELKMRPVAKASFVSGHTSMTAANTFFFAGVFSEYYPESKWKPVVWGGAIAIPAVTGYLRVRGGRHYPTDVIAGYALGAAVGYFIPKLHKQTNLAGKGISLDIGPESARLVWRFNRPRETRIQGVTALY